MTKATYTLWADHMGDYMDRRDTPPKRATSPTWGPHLHVNRAYIDVDNRERARARDKN